LLSSADAVWRSAHSSTARCRHRLGRGFVPKPQTPFQWFGQDTIAELRRKINLLRDATRGVRGLTLRWHSPRRPPSRHAQPGGPAHGCGVIERVWRAGAPSRNGPSHFDLGLWTDGLAPRVSASTSVYRRPRRARGTRLDQHLAGLQPGFLWTGLVDATAEAGVEDVPLDALL